MTVEKSKTINIPVWLVAVVMPALISIIIGFSANRFNAGMMETKIESAEKQIEATRNEINTKVSKDEFSAVKDQLNRIEVKLDGHIDK